MSSIKKILKLIFPTPLLKKGFLVYNRLRIRTVDKLVFGEAKVPAAQYVVRTHEAPFADIDISDVDEPVHTLMATWKTWRQEAFIVHWQHACVIEPVHGWAIQGGNTLIYESLSFSRTDHQKKPSLFSYWRRKNVKHYDAVISLRDTGEENYFHFYNDVLSKLYWMHINGLSTDLPVIVSHNLWSRAYLQKFLSWSPWLASLKWIVQSDEYISCTSAYFIKAPTHDPEIWRRMFSAVPEMAMDPGVRVFITRSRARLRYLTNEDDIVTICKAHGFQIVDNDAITYDEQVALYARAQVVVGIHGAGLSNMFFRNASCRLLEVFPSLAAGYLPFHYIMLAKMKRFEYHAVIGHEIQNDMTGGFYLEPEIFEEGLRTILSK